MREDNFGNAIGEVLGEAIGKMFSEAEDAGSRIKGIHVFVENLNEADDFPAEDTDEDEAEIHGLKSVLLKVVRPLIVLIMAVFFFYWWNLLMPLEEALVSDGHLQFMNGSVVLRAEWIRVVHLAVLLISAVISDKIINRLIPEEGIVCIFLFIVTAAIWLCIVFDLFLLNKEPGIVPIPDRYHKQFEAEWQRDPRNLLIEKGYVQRYSVDIDGDRFLYLMNYNGMFRNDFAFILDRENAEIRIPVDGNDRFFREHVSESAWNKPGSVTAEVFTDVEPCRPLLFSGSYDSEREAFVIPLTGPVQDARYGYCTVYLTGTDYTARQLFGERYQVRLWDLLRGKR